MMKAKNISWKKNKKTGLALVPFDNRLGEVFETLPRCYSSISPCWRRLEQLTRYAVGLDRHGCPRIVVRASENFPLTVQQEPV